METPPATPPVLAAGREIAGLWEQAFAPQGKNPGGRPTAERWVHALHKLESEFAKCPNHAGHYYARGITCPWCPIQMGTGTPPFPLPIGHVAPSLSGPFSLEAVWAQITSVQPPAVAPPIKAPQGLPASSEVQRIASQRILYKVGAAALAAGAFIGGLAVGLVWLICAVGAGVIYAWISSVAPTADLTKLRQIRTLAESDLRNLNNCWNRDATNQPFDSKLAELTGMRDQYRQLGTTHQAEYGKLVANREAAARRKFLDKFEIERAVITGIGPAKRTMLESYGIETAADLDEYAVLRVPGFGPALTQRLMEWRKGVEAKFRFDSNAAVDPRDVSDLSQRMGQLKRDLEQNLRKGAAELQQIRGSILNHRQALETPLRQAAEALAQAEANLAALR